MKKTKMVKLEELPFLYTFGLLPEESLRIKSIRLATEPAGYFSYNILLFSVEAKRCENEIQIHIVVNDYAVWKKFKEDAELTSYLTASYIVEKEKVTIGRPNICFFEFVSVLPLDVSLVFQELVDYVI